MKQISIFGASGSIGQNTLELIRRDKAAYEVVALTGDQNIAQLVRDVNEFRPQIVVTADEKLRSELGEALTNTDCEVAAGSEAIAEAASRPTDWVMSSIVGSAGLVPGLNALRAGATLALANKESLVAAGPLLTATAEQFSSSIIPVDSEHSAIFQALAGEKISSVERIIITASGGAFRDWPQADLARVTPQQAQNHPNWSMGQRITIDSASMFNKAFELIEAKELFKIDEKKIETVIHPESLVHAIVGFCDGGMMAHLGPTDMLHAIGYALNYPNRKRLDIERLDFTKIGQFRFFEANEQRYPALRLSREVMRKGGLWGAALNGAKEVALDRFITGDIGFLEMAIVVEVVLNEMDRAGDLGSAADCLDTILNADASARRLAGLINV